MGEIKPKPCPFCDAIIQFTKYELVKQWNSRSGGNE